MLVHSALCFMERISKKPTRFQFQHPNYVCFDAYKAKCVHTTIHDFQNIVQRFIEIACFPYVQLSSVDVDKHHDGCPSNTIFRGAVAKG